MNAFAKSVALALALVLFAGASAQADTVRDSVQAYSTNVHSLICTGSGLVTVSLTGDGDTDLDIEIVNTRTGQMVAWNYNLSDRAVVSFYPAANASYMIRVINRGGVYNVYTLRTW